MAFAPSRSVREHRRRDLPGRSVGLVAGRSDRTREAARNRLRFSGLYRAAADRDAFGARVSFRATTDGLGGACGAFGRGDPIPATRAKITTAPDAPATGVETPWI